MIDIIIELLPARKAVGILKIVASEAQTVAGASTSAGYPPRSLL